MLALAVACGNSFAGHGFEPARTAMDSINPSAVVVADVSGDDKDDLLVLTGEWPSDPARVHVLVQRPDGTLAPPLSYGFGTTDEASPRMLTVVATASPGIFDGVPGNNRASKRLVIRPTPASGRRAKLPAR